MEKNQKIYGWPPTAGNWGKCGTCSRKTNEIDGINHKISAGPTISRWNCRQCAGSGTPTSTHVNIWKKRNW